MRILFAPYGTRGDVQPMLALALGLTSRGHRVKFVAPSNSVAWIRAHGLECESNGVDVEAEIRAAGSDPAAMRGHRRRITEVLLPTLFETVSNAAEGVEAVVGAGIPLAAPSVAESRRVPYLYALFCPNALPNSESPPPVVPWQTLPRWLNALLWRAGELATVLTVGRGINAGRARLGLPPVRAGFTHLMAPTILAADPELAPLAADAWPPAAQTGAWILDDKTTLDPAVTAFLRSGPPPVYVGFGSMFAKSARGLAQCVLRAAELAGCRLLVAGGWASLDAGVSRSTQVLAVAEVPHDKVFPFVAAAVHHGGAGTTTAAARAGIPQVIVPHGFDQYYWGHRVAALGLGPPALPVGRLTADALAARLKAVCNGSGFRDRAVDLASRAAGRDGVPAAVQYLERFLNH